MKRASKTPSRSRPRKKAAAPVSTSVEAPEFAPSVQAPDRKVSELGAVVSLGLGALLIIAALFPRSFKQLAMLSLGVGLLYRGVSRPHVVHQSTGLDAPK